MKKRLLAAGLVLAGVIAFAGTCTIQNISLTTLNGHKVFAGEIHNDSGANLLQHKIHVAFFDSNNNLLDEQSVTPCLRSLQSGGVDYFSAASSSSTGSVSAALARLEFGSTLSAGTTESTSGTFSNIVITRKNATTLHIQGTYKNTDSTTLSSPNVCAVVYDNNNHVIIVGLDETLSDLSQNGSDTFSIDLTVVDSTATINHVNLYADGLHGNTPTNAVSNTNVSITVCTATDTPTPVTGTATNTSTPSSTATPASPTSTNTTQPTSTSTPICG